MNFILFSTKSNQMCNLKPSNTVNLTKLRDTEEGYYIVRAKNGAGPRLHIDIISVVHTIADGTISDTFLTSFQLFQQSKAPWHYTTTNQDKTIQKK